jgi:hypothetical protein
MQKNKRKKHIQITCMAAETPDDQYQRTGYESDSCDIEEHRRAEVIPAERMKKPEDQSGYWETVTIVETP